MSSGLGACRLRGEEVEKTLMSQLLRALTEVSSAEHRGREDIVIALQTEPSRNDAICDDGLNMVRSDRNLLATRTIIHF